MEESINKGQSNKKKTSEGKTFPVPYTLVNKKVNICITTDESNKPLNKPNKSKIINQALKFHSQGNISEAKKCYQYFINQGFQDHRIFSNYGAILKDLGNLQEAELFLRKAIEIDPLFSNAHYNLGNLLRDLNKITEAESSLRKAIELDPLFVNAYYNLGNILEDLGNLQEAELFQRKAIEIDPFFAKAHSNLGNILRGLGKLKEAEFFHRKAIEIDPLFALAHANLGTTLSDLGKLKAAELSLQKAIEIDPLFADAYFNLSLIELIKGNYQLGLENYEFRFKKKVPAKLHGKAKIKRISNTKFENSEKLLIVGEQGIGDTLQYMRYIPYLRNNGFDISFCTLKKLHTLIQASNIDPTPLTPKEINQISEGKWIPLLSLPRYLHINPKNPIITERYIYSTEELNKKWKKILSTEKRPIVGINWQGNPEMEKSSYQGRSIPLEIFSKLSDNNEIKLLSLQKGYGSEQLNHCTFKKKFVECQPQINSTWDFLENAAIIENCDLIITCDTSIAHLAGGMEKKVWLLLQDIPFWTWGLKGDSTFWYPSMRLFRQKERNNWNEVMMCVSSELTKEIQLNVL